jgi:hypothetical protein
MDQILLDLLFVTYFLCIVTIKAFWIDGLIYSTL